MEPQYQSFLDWRWFQGRQGVTCLVRLTAAATVQLLSGQTQSLIKPSASGVGLKLLCCSKVPASSSPGKRKPVTDQHVRLCVHVHPGVVELYLYRYRLAMKEGICVPSHSPTLAPI